MFVHVSKDGVLIGVSVENLGNRYSRVSFYVLDPFPSDFGRPGLDLIDMVDFSDVAFFMVGRRNVMPGEVTDAAVGGLAGDDRAVSRGVFANQDRRAALRLFGPEGIVRTMPRPIKVKRSGKGQNCK
jgi:hypothetical protein